LTLETRTEELIKSLALSGGARGRGGGGGGGGGDVTEGGEDGDFGRAGLGGGDGDSSHELALRVAGLEETRDALTKAMNALRADVGGAASS
jgi:hypothetical protein